MAATPPDTDAAPPDPTAAPTPALQGVLLERVRWTWAEARALGGAHHEPFTVAVGALAVYARACGVPVAEVVRAVHGVLGGDDASSPAWRELVRETAVRNYERVD